MGLSGYLKRIQNLPLIKRKIIFWSIIVIFGLILFALYIINIQQKIKIFPKEQFFKEIGLPKLEEGIKNLPKPELPNLEIEESLKKLEEIKKEVE